MSRVVEPSLTVAKRYWPRVDRRGPDECWLWTGANKKGYGYIYTGYNRNHNSVMEWAHRVAWELEHGASPGEMHVRHKCDNPPCQNPAHLELGTHLDNMRDMVERQRYTTVYGSHHGKSKLIEADVLEIRRMHAQGYSQKFLARQFGVTQSNISSICTGKTWAHLKDAS